MGFKILLIIKPLNSSVSTTGERLSIKTERDEQQLFNSMRYGYGLIVLIALCGIGTRLYFLQVKEHGHWRQNSRSRIIKNIFLAPHSWANL